ncbi:MAG: PD-(D/E)XK nuclease family protein [Rubrobacter sp.]
MVNNPDLERLEALLGRFNIFEAVGLVRQEIRHSAFLSFLLNPQENHGLRDAFVKRLLQEAIMSTPDTSAPVTPIELSLWDLDQIEVRREWQHIDIFLVDERNRLAVVIENKIDTGEHSDQLGRYYEVVKQHYPNCKVIGLYLTPAGDEKFTYLWVTGLSARFSTPWRRVRLRWPIPTYRFSLLITRRC